GADTPLRHPLVEPVDAAAGAVLENERAASDHRLDDARDPDVARAGEVRADGHRVRCLLAEIHLLGDACRKLLDHDAGTDDVRIGPPALDHADDALRHPHVLGYERLDARPQYLDHDFL